MNNALSKVGEGLIVGVMVAIVGSLTGILWNEYSNNSREMKLARELLEKQTGGSLQQDLFNDSTSKYMISQKSKNEEILSFIKYQLEENKALHSKLSLLLESEGIGSTGSAGNSPESDKASGRSAATSEDAARAATTDIEDAESSNKYKITEWDNEQGTLDQMQVQQQALQQNSKEQLQLQYQIKK